MTCRPNVLLITADQFRFDAIAAHGNPHVRTPNLDRLVREGVTFQRAYAESPVCVPARAGLLTGQLPHRNGITSNTTPLADGTPTVVRSLAAAGYDTQAIGKMHFTPVRAGHGFDRLWLSEEIPAAPEEDEYLTDLLASGAEHVLEPHGVRHELYYSPQPSQLPAHLHTTAWTGRRTREFLAARTPGDAPFFCWTSFIKPHPPFDPPYPYYLWYDPLDMPDPVRADEELDRLGYHIHNQHRVKWTHPRFDLTRIRVLRAYYYACVSHVDAEIGRILDQLDESGLRENTLVIFTADHGEYLGDHWAFGKRGYHDAAARIPLVLSRPATLPAGAARPALAGLTDVAPTVLAATGADPAGLDPDGLDLLPVATGGQETVRDVLLGQYHVGAEALYLAMNARHKYTYSAADDRESLYEVGGDETADLAGDGRHDAELTKLRDALLDQLSRDGYRRPLDGDGWRRFPRPGPRPPYHDRDVRGRGRQYPVWTDLAELRRDPAGE
ncbi:sulfatase family protein [Jiangella alkaliphila]|uniref:Arylsulfatase A n=1 Tax=Jiangella alkaliphila TaxID=419479 RepID=A0A1H2KJ65_9ACTN|nr:sulfatase-like hydrolase/transferase [Jiangella alkaliphila]SDU68456.1 Arylsulfatase A [Jiangella alkaliphila]